MLQPDSEWHGPKRSAATNCVEACYDGEFVHVRDSKSPAKSSLKFSSEAWKSFVAALKAGTIG